VRRYGPFAGALLLDALGGGGALLIAVRPWQSVQTPRAAPRPPDVLELTGRTVDGAPTALALVAVAGVVAVLATRGVVRRSVGVVVMAVGVGLIWRSVVDADAISVGRARALVADRHPTVDLTGVRPEVISHPVWAALSAVCGGLVVLAGALIAWRGHRWQVMSSRYDSVAGRSPEADHQPHADREPGRDCAPGRETRGDLSRDPSRDPDGDPEREQARAARTMWHALDRGEDPTD
jgi:uncharacterized membrane protein (TIGR02234 family)